MIDKVARRLHRGFHDKEVKRSLELPTVSELMRLVENSESYRKL